MGKKFLNMCIILDNVPITSCAISVLVENDKSGKIVIFQITFETVKNFFWCFSVKITACLKHILCKYLNINSGNNTKFLEQCPTLREYMKYVERVRKYLPDMELEAAVKRAVDECIREGILEDFFRKNKAEVIAMSIFEYDEKEVIDYIREEERAIGREEGQVEGRMEGKKEEAQKYGRLILRLTEEGKSSLVVKIATDDALRERLYEEYQL